MNLASLTIEAYQAQLSSSAPAPGGGAATALTASQGASLLAMVCNLTVGKEKFKEQETLVQEVLAKALQMKDQSLQLMDDDAQSFGEVGKVFTMPKETQEEKDARAVAMETALKGCTAPPIALMALSYEGLLLTQSVLGKTTPHAVSDLGVAALFFKSALQGAWLNVRINIGHIKDQEFAKEHEIKGKKYLQDGIALADKLYQEVESTL